MLVIPALLSLKPSMIEKGNPEAVEMLEAMLRRTKDSQDIVAKTSRKLILELFKCYPTHFDTNVVCHIKTEESRKLCTAI